MNADSLALLRLPPHSVEVEQSLLGGLMLDGNAWDRVAGLVSASDFYRPEHRLIFAAVTRLAESSSPADVITVFEALQRAGDAADAGGLSYLNELSRGVASAANVRRYAEIVRDQSVLRQLISACDEVSAKAYDGAPAREVLDFAAGVFGQLERTGQRVEPLPLDRLLAQALDRYSDLADGKVVPAIPTGIAPLDQLLNEGLRPGKVYGIAARPSIGKSSAARHIGLHTSALGHPTLLLSQEMPGDEVTDCVVAQTAGIDNARLQTGKLEQEDWTRLAEAANRLRGRPFHVDEQGGLRLADIRIKARSIKGLSVLILDYLQLSRSTMKHATTNDQMAEISRGLKALAMEMKIAVVVACQLNRDVEKRADREPQLSDIRDSGAIEQDLDVAVMLWPVREDEDGAGRLIGWKVAKHRGGRLGRFGMRFDAALYRWRATSESLNPPRAESRGVSPL